MGSRTSQMQVEEVYVADIKPHYPPPSQPKFYFGDLYKQVPLYDEKDLTDEGFDWTALELSLRAEEYKRQEERIKNQEIEWKNKGSIKMTPEKAHFKEYITGGDANGKQTGYNPNKSNDISGRHGDMASAFPAFNSRRKVDEHARQAGPDHLQMFESLFTYLKQPIKQGFYPQTFFVRSILVWLGFQNTEKCKYGQAELTTPSGILQHLQYQSLSFTKAFTLLCRAAGIPCVMIDGLVKAGRYAPGDVIDQDSKDTWCAVFVDESWQIVHPVWVCRGVYGKQAPGLVEIDENVVVSSVPTNHRTSKKGYLQIFNEDYFMPRPEEYIYKCYTEQNEWQLLPATKVINSPEDFMKLPYITKTFFTLGLTLVSDPFSILHSSDGKIRIEFIAPTNLASRLIFHSNLTQTSVTTGKTSNTVAGNMDYSKLVLNFRSNERIIFDVRLPFEGTYKLEISGGLESLYSLCRFKITCPEPMKPCIPLPADAGTVGWGPGPVAERAGLILPSNPNGFITILPTEEDRVIPPPFATPENIINISFQLGRNAFSKFDYDAELRAPYSLTATKAPLTPDMDKKAQKHVHEKAALNLGRCVEGLRDHANNLLKMRVTVPREGEYALVIKATSVTIQKERRIPLKNTTRPICFYLLAARYDWARQYTPEKLARRELHNSMAGGNIESIQHAIKKCKGAKISVVDNDIAAAELRIEYMKLRRDLEDCIKRRNHVIINNTLMKVLKYRYRSAFVGEIEQLLMFKDNLLQHGGYPRGVYTLKEAHEEIIKVARPVPEIHNTMKALLLMLGYYGKMDDWLVIQATMKVTADTFDFKNILKQMGELDDPSFPWKLVKLEHLERVKKKLYKHSYEKVFRANQAAALFYQWVERCLSRVPKKWTEDEETLHANKKIRQKKRSKRDNMR